MRRPHGRLMTVMPMANDIKHFCCVGGRLSPAQNRPRRNAYPTITHFHSHEVVFKIPVETLFVFTLNEAADVSF